MRPLLRITSILGLVVGLLALAALAGLVLESPAGAQTDTLAAATPAPSERVIRVTGQGQVRARPDTATVRIGVQTEADTATEALDENNVRMTQLISVTENVGIAAEDVRTGSLQLNPVYRSPSTPEGEPELRGYRASNIVEVTVRDLDILGTFLDAAVEAGGNTIQGIQFEVSDNEALRRQARAAAMEDATRKAEQLTALAGAELGPVLTITEVGVTPPPRPVALEAAQGAAEAVPVAAGTQLIEAHVDVSWQIQTEE